MNKIYKVIKFIEKPNEKKAKKLLSSKQVFWNSGIFLFKASTLLKNAEKFCPETLQNVKDSLKHKTFDSEFSEPLALTDQPISLI